MSGDIKGPDTVLVTAGPNYGSVVSAAGGTEFTNGPPPFALIPVTNSELAPMPANTLKGNNTGAPATPLDLTVAQVKTLLALAAPDVAYTPTTPGAWPVAPTTVQGGLDDLAALFFPTPHPFAAGAPLLVPGPAGTALNILSGTVANPTLPQANTWIGQFIIVKNNNLTGGVTIHAFAGDTIDGAATYVISGVYGSVTLYSDAAGVILAFPGLS